VDPSGIIATVAGDGYMHSVGDGGPAALAQLYQPSSLTLDSAGNLFIADSGTERVRQVLRDGTATTLAGTGTPGRGAADGSPAGNVALNTPMGVAMDYSGNVLVADTYNHRVLLVTPARAIRAVAGTGTGGASPDGTLPLVAQLRGPRAVCADRTGNLYIVDTSNHRVLRLPPGGPLQTAAGNGSKGGAGDDGAARFAQLNTPSACATDSAGNLFIADTANHVIRKVNPSGTISTVAGMGAAGTSGDEGAAIAARLDSPRGVVVDDAGDIFIADTGNHRIRQVTPDGLIHSIAGTGAAGFAGDSGPAGAALLNGPQGLFLDGAGDLYFADTGNNRIRRLVPEVVAPAPVIQSTAITVLNAISLREGAVAPGEIAAIFGAGLGPDTPVTGVLDAAGVLPASLGGVEVRFDGTPAPLFYAQSGQVNATVPVSPSAPAMLALATNPDGTPNAESAPAPRSTWMTFFATGEGLTDGLNVAGKPAAAPYPHPLLPIALTIAGVTAEILFAGSAPDMIGVLQINARVPGGFVAPGEAPVELTVGTAKAPPVTVWLK
jgi:sugar lactone lactonase YvrE